MCLGDNLNFNPNDKTTVWVFVTIEPARLWKSSWRQWETGEFRWVANISCEFIRRLHPGFSEYCSWAFFEFHAARKGYADKTQAKLYCVSVNFAILSLASLMWELCLLSALFKLIKGTKCFKFCEWKFLLSKHMYEMKTPTLSRVKWSFSFHLAVNDNAD